LGAAVCEDCATVLVEQIQTGADIALDIIRSSIAVVRSGKEIIACEERIFCSVLVFLLNGSGRRGVRWNKYPVVSADPGVAPWIGRWNALTVPSSTVRTAFSDYRLGLPDAGLFAPHPPQAIRSSQ